MIELPDKRFSVIQLGRIYLEGERLMEDLSAIGAFVKATTDAGEARLGPILYWLWYNQGERAQLWARDPFSIQAGNTRRHRGP